MVAVVIDDGRDALPGILDVVKVSPQVARRANGFVIRLEYKQSVSVFILMLLPNSIRLNVITTSILLSNW